MIASRIDDDAKRWGTYANVADVYRDTRWKYSLFHRSNPGNSSTLGIWPTRLSQAVIRMTPGVRRLAKEEAAALRRRLGHNPDIQDLPSIPCC
jgi:hypothetical protein